MFSNGVRLTLKPPDGEPFTQGAILTLGKGPNGGYMYHGNGGLAVEIIDRPDGSHDVADWGWPDGKRDHVLTSIRPAVE